MRLLVPLFAALVGGCVSLGPTLLVGERLDYNLAVQRTNDEQLLLNLVRLRYRDTPHFLEVSSVSTQFNIAADAGLKLPFRPNSDPVDLNGGIAYSERPTISYAPLQGEEFIERVLSPTAPEKIQLLYRSGWAIDRVLRLCVQRLNGLKNASSASGPTPTGKPDFEEFQQVTALLRVLQLRDAITLSYEQRDNKSQLLLRLGPQPKVTAEIAELRRRLGLEPGEHEYVLVGGPAAIGGSYIAMETRSLLGTLFFLSVGVEIPTADVEAGRVTLTQTDTGAPFDWSEVVGDLFRVQTSESRPSNASVAIRYRDHWFYIDDSDLASKSTFALLTQLFSLQAGGAESVAPVLTLPVG